MQTDYPILDHGYLRYIEHWGSDERIIEAARQSTGKNFVSWEPYEGHPKGDAGLLSYLWRNQHATVFEFCGLVIEVQAPIFCFREWHRHRTQSYSEISARYTPLPNLNYLPTVQRVVEGAKETKNRQATGNPSISQLGAEAWLEKLDHLYHSLEEHYQDGLRVGVPKELARLCLPVGRYSRMRATANLRNWLHFCGLRMAPNAQLEIRLYAEALGKMLQDLFPRTWGLFAEGLQRSV